MCSCNEYFWKSEVGSFDFVSYLLTSVNVIHVVFKT